MPPTSASPASPFEPNGSASPTEEAPADTVASQPAPPALLSLVGLLARAAAREWMHTDQGATHLVWGLALGLLALAIMVMATLGSGGPR